MGIFKRKERGRDYGIFILTERVNSGEPVRFCWRQEPDDEVGTNGWSLFSGNESEEDMGSLVMVGIMDIERLAPTMKDVFDAPVGTELGWLYDDAGNHIGFHDMAKDKDVTVEEILRG